jgi:hypothetical protein
MPRQVPEHGVKTRDLRGQVRERIGSITAAFEKCARIAQNGGHMSNKISGRSHLLARLERPKCTRRASQGLLCAISKDSKKMTE